MTTHLGGRISPSSAGKKLPALVGVPEMTPVPARCPSAAAPIASTSTLNHRDGALWICIVARVRDGQITRIDEYMDSSKFATWAGAPDAAAEAAATIGGDR